MKTITDYILQYTNPFISELGVILGLTVGLFAILVLYVTWWPSPRPTQVSISLPVSDYLVPLHLFDI
jgi:hypothetical protein